MVRYLPESGLDERLGPLEKLSMQELLFDEAFQPRSELFIEKALLQQIKE
jgi:hypothetical protein